MYFNCLSYRFAQGKSQSTIINCSLQIITVYVLTKVIYIKLTKINNNSLLF